MGWFRDNKSGRVMSILNDDVNQLERFLDGGANDILQVGTTVICVTGAFFYFSPGDCVVGDVADSHHLVGVLCVSVTDCTSIRPRT